MRTFLNQPLWIRVIRGVVLAGVLAAVAFFTPTPYVLHAPGPAHKVRPMISITDAKLYSSTGEFLLTTVLEEPATVMYCLYGWLDPEADLTTGSGNALQAQSPGPGNQMEWSQYLATRVALQSLGYEVRGRCVGLRVLDLLPDSPNLEQLKIGDILTEADGQALDSTARLQEITGYSSLQTGLPIRLKRDGQVLELELSLYRPDGHTRIGVIMRPEFADQNLPVDVSFRDDGTVGASGGLVFALDIYDQMTSKDLTQGRRIAATGVMEADGILRPVQGIKYKLIGAERAEANLFLIPRDNWDEVKNTPTRVKIVPVSSFQEALDALR